MTIMVRLLHLLLLLSSSSLNVCCHGDGRELCLMITFFFFADTQKVAAARQIREYALNCGAVTELAERERESHWKCTSVTKSTGEDIFESHKGKNGILALLVDKTTPTTDALKPASSMQSCKIQSLSVTPFPSAPPLGHVFACSITTLSHHHTHSHRRQ